MKYLKIFIVLLASLFVFNTGVNAANKNTIAALREELAAHKKSYNQAASNANRTKAEINASKGKIFSSHDEIKKNKELIEKAKVEIETLNVDIAKKDEDIKKYMNALQKTMGNNIYLEYLLDAKNYADLVYRYAIIEQVADYDKKQIESFEKQIEKNKELQVELAAREIKLNELISNLEKTVKSLGKEYDDLMEITLDVKEQLKAMEQYIAYLISIGCKENDDIDACIGQHGDSGFIRPVPYGTITSYYGYRKNPITGKKQSWHGAIDIGGMKEGSNVYSAANGTVALILRKQSCGGNMVYIHHNISGKYYTTAYYHLLNIKVKVGDMVTRNSIVGTAGGGWGTPWDGCSTGVHLHFVIATGWYGRNCGSSNCYTSSATFNANAVNPRDYIKFPDKYVWFNTR